MSSGKAFKRVTIADIAQATGYSKTSVSFAFNSPQRISEQARKRILSTAEQLGYYPDSLARNFSLQRHHSIGFLIPHDISLSLENPYIVEVLEGIGSVCRKQEYTLTLIPPFGESLSKAIRSAAVDGLITLGMEAEMRVVQIIRQKHIPYVTIDGTPSDGMPSVNIDDLEAAREGLEHLLSLGHRRIALISIKGTRSEKTVNLSVIDRRMEGFKRALAGYGLSSPSRDVRMYHSSSTFEGGIQAARELLSGDFQPTAICAMSDIIALGCLDELRREGVRVPGDISVTGFDHIAQSDRSVPPLTTMDQPGGLKGERSAQMLFSMLAGADVDGAERLIPHRLIQGGSTGRV